MFPFFPAVVLSCLIDRLIDGLSAPPHSTPSPAAPSLPPLAVPPAPREPSAGGRTGQDAPRRAEELDSDVLALQEVDQYDSSAPWLREQGYGGVWKCRTTMTANKKDGCGLFYKRDKFELLARREIEYNDIAFGHPVGGAGRRRDGDASNEEENTGAGAGADVGGNGSGSGGSAVVLTEKMQTHVRTASGLALCGEEWWW